MLRWGIKRDHLTRVQLRSGGLCHFKICVFENLHGAGEGLGAVDLVGQSSDGICVLLLLGPFGSECLLAGGHGEESFAVVVKPEVELEILGCMFDID